MPLLETFTQADAVGRAIALLLLLMSVSSWVAILWKTWLLRRAQRNVHLSTAAFWQAPDLELAQQRLSAFDRAQLLTPLLLSVRSLEALPAQSLAAAVDPAQQLTRALRDAMRGVCNRLQYGQVLLATIGSTAPFVGLLGTVWGVYHALVGIGMDAGFRIEQVSGPVGEALVMTAAGLAVAIPAVLAYNVFGRKASAIEALVEGFAHDLRELMLSRLGQQPPADPPPSGSAGA